DARDVSQIRIVDLQRLRLPRCVQRELRRDSRRRGSVPHACAGLHGPELLQAFRRLGRSGLRWHRSRADPRDDRELPQRLRVACDAQRSVPAPRTGARRILRRLARTGAMTSATVAGLIALGLALPAAPLLAQPRETLSIDASPPAQPFAHFWEHMFGSGRAVLSLRESYREDLRVVREATAVSYVRFHAILHDEMGVYTVDKKGAPVFNFSYVDQAYDGLLANGVR